MKKFLCMFLIFAMCLALGASAFAETAQDVVGTWIPDSIEIGRERMDLSMLDFGARLVVKEDGTANMFLDIDHEGTWEIVDDMLILRYYADGTERFYFEEAGLYGKANDGNIIHFVKKDHVPEQKKIGEKKNAASLEEFEGIWDVKYSVIDGVMVPVGMLMEMTNRHFAFECKNGKLGLANGTEALDCEIREGSLICILEQYVINMDLLENGDALIYVNGMELYCEKAAESLEQQEVPAQPDGFGRT